MDLLINWTGQMVESSVRAFFSDVKNRSYIKRLHIYVCIHKSTGLGLGLAVFISSPWQCMTELRHWRQDFTLVRDSPSWCSLMILSNGWILSATNINHIKFHLNSVNTNHSHPSPLPHLLPSPPLLLILFSSPSSSHLVSDSSGQSMVVNIKSIISKLYRL